METQLNRFKDLVNQYISHTEKYPLRNWGGTFLGVRGESDCIEIDYTHGSWSMYFVKQDEPYVPNIRLLRATKYCTLIPNWLTAEKFAYINDVLERGFEKFPTEYNDFFDRLKTMNEELNAAV